MQNSADKADKADKAKVDRAMWIAIVVVMVITAGLMYQTTPASRERMEEVARIVRDTEWASCNIRSKGVIDNAETYIQDTLAKGELVSKDRLSTVEEIAQKCNWEVESKSRTISKLKEQQAAAAVLVLTKD